MYFGNGRYKIRKCLGGPDGYSPSGMSMKKLFKQLPFRVTVYSIGDKCVLNVAANCKIYKIPKEILIKKENKKGNREKIQENRQ